MVPLPGRRTASQHASIASLFNVARRASQLQWVQRYRHGRGTHSVRHEGLAVLFRRVKKHVKAQDWFAVVVDFIIVVIGVFIGIQVANWNDARQTERRAAEYLDRLDDEFDVIRARLESGIEVFGRSVQNIDLIMDARRDYAADPSSPLPDDKTLASAVNDVNSGRIPAGSPAAFKEMVASGALDTLSSEPLRQALFAYDEFAHIARDGWRSIRDEQRAAANAVTATIDVEAPDDIQSLDNSWLQSRGVVGVAREAILTDPALQGHLNILLRAQMNQYTLVERQLALANEIEALIVEARQ